MALGLSQQVSQAVWDGLLWSLLLTAVFIAFRSAWSAIYNIYFHPLRHFPGPWLATSTPWPYVRRVIDGGLVPWLEKLHAEYGNVVRIKPDELSFIDGSAWQDIYAARPQLPKPVAGSIVAVNGTRPIATIVHTPDHTRQRRILGHAFSDRALKAQEYILQNYTDTLVRQLHAMAAAHKEVNLCDWFNFITFDIVADLCFGESFNNLETGKHHNWIASAFRDLKFLHIFSLFSLFPPLDRWVVWLIPDIVKKKANQHFEYCAKQIQQRMAQQVDRPDIMQYILENNHSKGMTRDEIDATVQLLVFAGSETSATTMTSVTWFSLRHPEVWQRLTDEIRSAFTSYDDINVTSASKLTFLHATICEALRLHPPAPVALPRIVDRPGVMIAGRLVPENTIVGIHQKVAYHSPLNFNRPKRFRPERWLPEGQDEFSSDSKNVFEPFSVGPRNCIGKSLAWAEMKLVLCKVIWTTDIQLLEQQGLEDWADQKVYVAHEKGPMMARLNVVKRRE